MAKIKRIKSALPRFGILRRDGHLFYDPERDGITFSLLSTFLDCREKARLYLQGWTPMQNWMATTFGAIVHAILQLAYTDIRLNKLTKLPTYGEVSAYITAIVTQWHRENPRADAETKDDVEFTAMLAQEVLPLYFQYWYRDFSKLEWEALEANFRVPLPVVSLGGRSYRTFIQGKIDGLFKHAGKKAQKVLETKTKSYIDQGTISDVLPFELQVNIYMTGVAIETGKNPSGVLYNIIRRPQLRQKQTESRQQFAHRIAEDIKKRPDFYFVRMELTVERTDMDAFRKELHEMVGDFMDWWNGRAGHYKSSGHCQTRYGQCPMLPICGRNDYTKHYKRDVVFRELEEY